jgi:hypothetical protein
LPLLRAHDRPQLLLVTTNYDDLVERALAAADEPFDVVCEANGARHGALPAPSSRR